MYVTTFYSFKGGVGRTMALVNVAVMLAKMRRRVLVVDFDLEAPGLPSYQVFSNANCARGVVDYVTSYRATGAAPVAGDYITECQVDGASIWLMPAGDHSSNHYSELLQSIDWQDLYEHQEGYLMFEDLREQWAQYDGQGFDYVLIDSRTGHTDVGGICTRQLPDAVVVMFLPNEQNIAGLVPIVKTIREEKESRLQPIDLIFCPSNVPDLDDENDILKKLLDQASKKLEYEQDADAIIYNYGSLEVLTQAAFAISRPRSRLAKEYDHLKTSIISRNFADHDGAVAALEKMPDTLNRARARGAGKVLVDLKKDATDIRRRHPKDGQIAFLAARVFNEIGDQTEELEALNTCIAVGHDVARCLLHRVVLYLTSFRREEAKADLLQILTSPAATVFELVPALELAQSMRDFRAEAVDKALDRPDTNFDIIRRLLPLVSTERSVLPTVIRHMDRFAGSNHLGVEDRRTARSTLILSLVGAGNFDRARAIVAPEGSEPRDSAGVDDQFNYAMVMWGITGQVPIEAFEKVVRKFAVSKAQPTANWHQCYALALAMTGQLTQALSELDLATKLVSPGGMDFSCWTYLTRASDDLSGDLEKMRTAFGGKDPILPEFFGLVPDTFS
jgi:MinD-like ATPase involved in chromosome partitioning or flagellar assembly